MKKIWLAYKRDFRTNNWILVASLLLGLGFFALYVYVWHKPVTIRECCDACFLVFIVLFSFSILVLLARWGTYDTMAYGFRTLGHYMFNGKKDRKYEDLIDYKEKKMATRANKGTYFIPLLATSLVFLVATIVFEIIFASLY